MEKSLEHNIDIFHFIKNGGEMGTLMREKLWNDTKLGSPEQWPVQLKQLISTMLVTPSPMLICWGQDYIQFYNDAFRPILGNNKHPEALGIGADATYAEIWETIRPLFEGVMQGTPVAFQDFKLLMDRNGYLEEVYFDFSYSPIQNENGLVLGILVICSETTEKVNSLQRLGQSEQRFQNLVRDATVGIVVLSGKEMRVNVVNSAYGKLIGRSREELIGKNLFEIIPEAEPYYRPLLENVRTSGEPLHLNSTPYSVGAGDKKIDGYLNVVYQPYREKDGTITGVIALCVDITDLKNAENALMDSKALLEQLVSDRTGQLERSNQDLLQFAHVASHDLKEPVRKIKTYANLLQDESLANMNEKENQYVSKILSAAGRMSVMIDGVLNFSTISNTEQKNEPIDLKKILVDIENDLEIVINQTVAKIEIGNLPIIEGANVLIYQLFYNLLNNSLKFIKKGRVPHISITSNPILLNGKDFVRITFQDNGIGFEQKFASKIFDTFARLNAKDIFEGTGLGLALCKKIVERHHGKIEAHGVLDEGAKFIITLPLKSAESIN